MPKAEKVKVNVKEKVEDNVCDLSLSELTDVPVREIASFKRVNVLDLSSNRLLTLGRSFTTLTRLVKLDLSKNQLKYLPDDFGLLKNLRHLDLYNNKLEHLPLSFGNLSSLRYLDLKGNPLMTALAKVVGLCLTTKDCQDSARNTVRFLAHMQQEADKVQEQLKQQAYKELNAAAAQASLESAGGDLLANENLKNKKANKKSKAKKNKNATSSTESIIKAEPIIQIKPNKSVKSRKSSITNGGVKRKSRESTALASIFTFCLLLVINIVVIYMIMFKNPEIADKLVEFIPAQYRDWILTKTEFMRLRVGDWISQFRTPPEEH